MVAALAEKSAGTQLVATVEGGPLTISGQMVAFAYRGLAVTVIMMSMTGLDKAQVTEVARAAEAKVEAVS